MSAMQSQFSIRQKKKNIDQESEGCRVRDWMLRLNFSQRNSSLRQNPWRRQVIGTKLWLQQHLLFDDLLITSRFHRSLNNRRRDFNMPSRGGKGGGGGRPCPPPPFRRPCLVFIFQGTTKKITGHTKEGTTQHWLSTIELTVICWELNCLNIQSQLTPSCWESVLTLNHLKVCWDLALCASSSACPVVFHADSWSMYNQRAQLSTLNLCFLLYFTDGPSSVAFATKLVARLIGVHVYPCNS